MTAPALDPVVVALQDARREQGLSRRALADRAGLAHVTINRLESGERSPNLWTLRRVAEALGLDLAVTGVPAAGGAA